MKLNEVQGKEAMTETGTTNNISAETEYNIILFQVLQ